MKEKRFIKHTILPLCCAGIAMIFACCQQQDEACIRQDLSDDAGVPVEVSASVFADVATRAQTPVDLTEGTIGIFRLAVNDYTSMENIQYSRVKGENWKPATSTIIYVGANAASLCAYSPYGATTFSNTTATLTAQPYNATKDMSYAITGGSDIWKKTPEASFEMKHAYARLKLSVTRDALYPGACKVTKVAFTTQDGTILTANTTDISTGTSGSGTSAAKYECAVTTSLGTTGLASGAKDDTSIDVLMIPQPLAAANGLKVSLTVDGTKYSVVVPGGKLAGLVAGEQYTVSLTMLGKAIEIEGVNITKDWETSQVGSGDKDATFD